MLAGIKTGKKKKRKISKDVERSDNVNIQPDQIGESLPGSNQSAADELKHLFGQRRRGGTTATAVAPVAATKTPISRSDSLLPYERIGKRLGKEIVRSDNNETIVLTGEAAKADSSRPEYEKEDFRNGSRKGKKRRVDRDVAGTSHDEANLSVLEMLQQEKESSRSMDEVYARNVARLGSRYKGTELKRSSATGADEEDLVDTQMYTSASQAQRLTKVASQQREKARQLAQHDKQTAITAKCWWWMESSRFQKHTLLALGNHVSLVMAPPNLSLFPGNHFYLVPIKHADSLVGCDDAVWDEIVRFQTSLRQMYGAAQPTKRKGLLCYETVLPRQKGLWQTRMEVVAVPVDAMTEAPLFFQSALSEQREEWGTHTKTMSTRQKNNNKDGGGGGGLRRTIPKNFDYFYIEYGPDNDGSVQIIESNTFPKDFAIDTIAGMLQMDPIRFKRKKQASMQEEKKLVLAFCDQWRPYDWTLQLD